MIDHPTRISEQSRSTILRSTILLRALVGAAIFVALAQCRTQPVHAEMLSPACRSLAELAGSHRDATSALASCFNATPANGEIAIPEGRYVLRSRVTIAKSVFLHTAGVSVAAAGCRPGDVRCATFVLIPDHVAHTALFAVLANDTKIDHVAFEGSKNVEPAAGRAACASADRKPAGGGLQVSGSNITISRSAFARFPCYTALEYEGGNHTNFVGNNFTENGSHDASRSWSDGLTIHDGRDLHVVGNRFSDNTDVQLIFGGCQHCTIQHNVFRHSGAPDGGAFAELMIHAWPGGATSGDFSGTRVATNDIDCSASKRCGFGLMIGATPWYVAPTFGGTVEANKIVNAMIGININDLTGPMIVRANTVAESGGQFVATCGKRSEAAINVSPQSEGYVDGTIVNKTSQSKVAIGRDRFSGCLLNYPLVH